MKDNDEFYPYSMSAIEAWIAEIWCTNPVNIALVKWEMDANLFGQIECRVKFTCRSKSGLLVVNSIQGDWRLFEYQWYPSRVCKIGQI